MITFPILLKIKEVIIETDECKTFVLERPHDFQYKSGQYLTIQISDSVSQTRSYSFSSASHEQDLSITIKYVDNGLFSRHALQNLQVGDEIKVVGIYGTFISQNLDRNYIMFAAGSGIVPVFSIIKELIHTHPDCNIHLHYSSQTPERTIFYTELEILEKKFQTFNITYYFSQIVDEVPKRINNFDIPEIVREHNADTLVYICGPLEYMDTISINARTHGVPKEHIFMEDYLTYEEYGYEGEDRQEPEDTSPHKVTISVADETHDIVVQYPKSILETALEAGIKLPYSCFSGLCGHCVANKISGDIFMIYNQILTQEEIESGLILTCQGFPINGDADIEF